MNHIEPERRPLLDWVLQRYSDTPRTRAKQWILAGRVRVGGEVIRQPHQILADPGRQLELLERHATSLNCGTGWQIHPRVTLLHLDGAVVVVNKGAGLLSVPAPQAELSALSIVADFLAGRLRPRDRSKPGQALPSAYRRLQPLAVHRLDQYTSGVFCLAMNPDARVHLIAQLKAHTMKREYLAFVEGRPPTSQGTWRDWLELSDDEWRQRVVGDSPATVQRPKVQEAITHFEVMEMYTLPRGAVTKLRLTLETGRRHQIRVQAAHAGLPLIGDRTYNPRYRRAAGVAPIIEFARQALHAATLTLEHPDQPGTRLSWSAPLPKELQQLEAAFASGCNLPQMS